MPTLPMYKIPPESEASHQMASPGGYEVWRLEAADGRSDVRVVAALMAGCLYHPGYVRHYYRYLRRPTRVPPPLPADWPCAHLSVYRGGRVESQFLTQYPAHAMQADGRRLDVRLAFCRLWRDGEGIRFSIRGKPGRRGGGTLAADFLVQPGPARAHQPVHLFNGTATTARGEHWWAPIALACAVRGQVSLRRGTVKGNSVETIPLEGQGCVDHQYGTAPAGVALTVHAQGTAFFGFDGSTGFRIGRAKHRPGEDILHLVESDGTPLLLPPVRVGWHSPPGKGLAYPTHVDAGPRFRLEGPRVLESAGAYVRLLYAATRDGTRGEAMCEVLDPHGLVRPIRGRQIERTFLRPMETGVREDAGTGA